MTDKEREILKLMYEYQIELLHHQGQQIAGLKQAIDSLERSHEIVVKLMKATGDLMGTN